MGSAVAAAPAASAQRLARVREWWRATHPPPSLGQRLDFLYTVAIMTAIGGALAYGTASSALAQVVTPEWLAHYGPSLALVALLLALRWGVYQGPVVFTVPDVAHLLGAPLPRSGLALRPFARALAWGALAGALVAGLLVVGLAAEGRSVAVADGAGLVGGCVELGLLGVAGAWAVERSARWERVVWRAGWPVVFVAAALAAAAGAGAGGRAAARWSGPWGWAMQPGAGAAEWPAALGALTLVCVVAVLAALRSRGDCPAERHLRRAEARASAIASLATFDARTARRALETAGTTGGGRLSARLRRPRAARLGLPWRDAVAALRRPGRVVEAVALAAGGTVLALTNSDRPLALAAGVLGVYLGAARLLWPLRAELDAPGRARTLLRPRLGLVVRAHMLLSVLVTTGAAALGAAGCAVAGGLPDHGAGAALLAVTVAPVACGCAAMSARRGGRLPTTVFATAVAADPSGGAGAIGLWLALWPVTAVVAGTIPLLLVAGPGAVAVALLWTFAAGAILFFILGSDPGGPG
jgi:hypothetical protein